MEWRPFLSRSRRRGRMEGRRPPCQPVCICGAIRMYFQNSNSDTRRMLQCNLGVNSLAVTALTTRRKACNVVTHSVRSGIVPWHASSLSTLFLHLWFLPKCSPLIIVRVELCSAHKFLAGRGKRSHGRIIC